jgi:hypothetical protein
MSKNLQKIGMIITLACITFINNNIMSQVNMAEDSVIMGAGYANEIYYNMANGQVSSYPRNSWDIAIRTRIMSSSILTNDGTGVVLYTYPKSDTSGWSTFDTAGYKNWTPMFNDQDDWENGAFSRNATGGLDFGWGVYNTTTHFITGDSLFLIKLRDGSLRKIWIQVKKAGEDLVNFKYATIDGSDEHDVFMDCNLFTAKDFLGFSLETNEPVDYQPDLLSWDIVFTKYMSVQQGESGHDTTYPVTGVLNNEGVYAEKFLHAVPDFTGYNPYGWDSTRASIGYNWKTFNGASYDIADSLAYFVQTKAGDVYKLVFDKFVGSGGGGKVYFKKGKVAGVGIGEKGSSKDLKVFPNPVKDRMVIYLPEEQNGQWTLVMNDLSGRTVIQKNINLPGTTYSMDLSWLSPGVYLLKVFSEKDSFLKKVIVGR